MHPFKNTSVTVYTVYFDVSNIFACDHADKLDGFIISIIIALYFTLHNC